MASIREEFTVDATPDAVWSALRDYGAVHTRPAVGFVVDCTMEEGDVRVITFGNGMVVREKLVGIDDAARRVAYTVIGGTAAHHNASAQVMVDADGRTRFVWITDVLPDAAAKPIGAMMKIGAEAMRKTLSQLPAR